MTYHPYRGEIEPIIEVSKAEIKFHPNHLEVINNYTYKPFFPEPGEDSGHQKAATMYPKHMVIVELSEAYHEKDPSQTTHPVVRILCQGQDWQETIHVETEKEAYDIYSKLKNWLINE